MPRMKNSIPVLLATVFGSALNSHLLYAEDLMSQCLLGVPAYHRPWVEGQNSQLPVKIKSHKVQGFYPDRAVFSGNVDVQQGNSRLQSDEIQLHQKTVPGQSQPLRTIDAQGNVHYDDDRVILKGPKAWSNLDNKDTDVWNGDYLMVGRQGRGIAEQMKLRRENRYIILKNGSFTSCLPGDNSWSVVGSEVIQDREEQVAEIWNARFKIGAVPVFYSPYMQLPIGDRRRSGFLIPDGSRSSNNGFEFTLPYYWNIAPNVDATLSPHYMSERGLQYQNQFRYLTGAGSGLLEFDYLPSDDIYNRDHPEDRDSSRWFLYWHHAGVYNQNWRFYADYSKASDSFYFTDLSSPFYSSTDGYLTQKFSIGYAEENWNVTVASKDFQVFRIQNVYRAQPQIDFNVYQNDVGPFDTHLYAQAVHFTNVNSDYPDATRLHLEPTLNLPVSTGWSSLDTEVKLLATHYQQNEVNYYNNTEDVTKVNQLQTSVNRVMPQFKMNGKLILERQMDWEQGYTQTLEPSAQYLYIPFRDQSHIYAYDSTPLQSDYTGLFRERSFSGLDRIASANQLTTGVTSRVFDSDSVERFNISVGQIYSFTPSRTGVSNTDSKANIGSQLWAADSYWKITERWGARGGIQYDRQVYNVSQGNAVLEYRRDEDRMIQLNYRYSSAEYVAAALQEITPTTLYKDGISQVGVTASWPIANNWAVVGAHYYDTRAKQSADQLIALQYSSCCYAIRIGHERKITGLENNRSQYIGQTFFKIELRGLSPDYSLGTSQMLRHGILPYQRAF